MTPTREQRLSWLAIVASALLVLAVQVLGPVGVPLYDGVVVQEPYRYLHPTGDQAGDPGTFSSTVAVEGGVSPVIAAYTTEGPPQAQMAAQHDAFQLTPGSTNLAVSIVAVEPQAQPSGGTIAGNVYRFAVRDQAGTALAIKPCEGCISLSLRSPEGIDNATLQRFANGAWTEVETSHAGTVALYGTNPTQLGDYAVVTSGDIEGDGGGGLTADRLLVAGGAAVILLLLFAAALVFRRRPEPEAPPRGRSRAIPTKRKASRRPPKGRSDR